MKSYVKLQGILAGKFKSEYFTKDFQVSAAAYRQIFSQALHHTEYKRV